MDKQLWIPRTLKIVIAVCLVLFAAADVSAAGWSVSTLGEYVMSDMETEAAAEERAFIRAKQKAAEQGAVYAENHIKNQGGKVTKERAFSIAWNSIRETHRSVQKASVPGGTSVILELTAALDDADVDNAFSRSREEQRHAALMVNEMQRIFERLDGDIEA